jgi:hypothetical protein
MAFIEARMKLPEQELFQTVARNVWKKESDDYYTTLGWKISHSLEIILVASRCPDLNN